MGNKSVFLIVLVSSVTTWGFTSSKSIDYLGESGGRVSVGSGSCGSIPSHIESAFNESINFTKQCPTAKLAPGKNIAINDYTSDGTRTMYVFNQSGQCLMTAPISWGVGGAPPGSLSACSTTNSRMTPPGFHLTAMHMGRNRFNSNNSIGLAGLSGQNSHGSRGILIHSTNGYGSGSSWGCTGVPSGDFSKIKSLLGYGSLVYNHFNRDQKRGCGSSVGFAPTCQPEASAIAASYSQGAKVINKGTNYEYPEPPYSGSGSSRRGSSGAGGR